MAVKRLYEVGGKPPVQMTGQVIEQVFEFTADTDYATGGYAISDSDFGIDPTIVIPDGATTGGYVPAWDATNAKLMFLIGNYDAADGPLIETTVGDNGLDGQTCRLLVRGVAA